MGTKDFMEDYIEYLERNNANLQSQSIRIKEFESRLLNKELRNEQCELVLEDIKNICNSTCQAIDKFFENFSTTMNSLKTVLMWKSQVHLIPQRLAVALNPDINEVSHTTGSSNGDSGFSSLNDNNQSKNGRKCGTAKVCPMIKGHIISAPRIHLNRVREDLGPESRRPLTAALSPIIEQSPRKSPHEAPSPVFRNVQIPLHRLRIGNFTGKKSETEDSYRTDGSPKINFRGRKCSGFDLRKRYSSMGENERFRMMRDRRTEVVNGTKHEDEIAGDGHGINEEAPSYAADVLENCETHGRNVENIDPLEGPSWLLDKQQKSEESEHSRLSNSPCRFVNVKRPHYVRSNEVINDDNQKRDVLNFNDDAQMGNFEIDPNHTQVIRQNSFPHVKDSSEKNSSKGNEESLSEDSSSSSFVGTRRTEEYDKIVNSSGRRSKVNSPSFRDCSLNRSSLERKSIHQMDSSSMVKVEGKPYLRRSNASGRLSNERNYSGSGRKSSGNELLLECAVNLSKLPPDIVASSETPKRWKVSEVDSTVVGKCEGRSTKRRSTRPATPTLEVPMRTKRRAAEKCIENKVWVNVTPKWEEKIRKEEKSRRNAQKKVSKGKKSDSKGKF